MQALLGLSIGQIFECSGKRVSQSIDEFCNVCIEKIRESGKEYAENTQDSTFYKPYYWKKVLINTLRRDFEKTKKRNFKPYFVMDDEKDAITNDLKTLINRYASFVNKCAEGDFFLPPRTGVRIICDYTKDKDSTFYAFALASFALPLSENDEEYDHVLSEIFAQIPRLNKEDTPLLYQAISQQAVSRERLSFSEKKYPHRTNSSETAETDISKTAVIGFLVLTMFCSVKSAFNATQFYQAARDWNYTNGPFNVFNQLVIQKNCDLNETFCEVPLDLVPRTVTNLTGFYWDSLGLKPNNQ